MIIFSLCSSDKGYYIEMDKEAVIRKRQEEMEAKKKRIAEMKQAREAAAANAAKSALPSPSSPMPVPHQAFFPPTAGGSSTSTSIQSPGAAESKSEPNNDNPQSFVSSILGAQGDHERKKNKIKAFTITRLSSVILPAEKVTYEKECQTEADDQTFLRKEDDEDENDREYVVTLEPKFSSHRLGSVDSGGGEPQTPGRKGGRPMSGRLNPSALPSFTSLVSDHIPPVPSRKIDEEERVLIMSDKQFLSFFEHAALHVERALTFNSTFDILRDFTQETSANKIGSTEQALMSTETVYECETLKYRPIMDIRSSTLRPELFLAAYGSKPSVFNTTSNNAGSKEKEEDSPGLVCVWARDLPTRPEVKLIAPSPVLTACFHDQEPQLVFGGCYSGQILLWDMSSDRRSLPIQRSSWLASASTANRGHRHPVYAMALTMSHELVSVSVDGLLCVWDAARLTEPLSSIQLELPITKTLTLNSEGSSGNMSLFSPPLSELKTSQPPLNVSCLAYRSGHGEDTSTGSSGEGSSTASAGSSSSGGAHIIVGSGAGELFKASLPYKPLNSNNSNSSVKMNAHYGLITAVAAHPNTNDKHRHLLLTASLDWTVKLWNALNLSAPLYEFSSPTCDYVCDVAWSLSHPAVFATASSTGRVCLWNLARSVTEPVDVMAVSKDSTGADESNAGSASASKKEVIALNKILFSRDGQSLIVGDSSGAMYKLKIHMSHVTPTSSDESKLAMVLYSANNTLLIMQQQTPKKMDGSERSLFMSPGGDEDDGVGGNVQIDLDKEV